MHAKPKNTGEVLKTTSIVLDHTEREEITRMAAALGTSFDHVLRLIIHDHVATLQSHNESNTPTEFVT